MSSLRNIGDLFLKRNGFIYSEECDSYRRYFPGMGDVVLAIDKQSGEVDIYEIFGYDSQCSRLIYSAKDIVEALVFIGKYFTRVELSKQLHESNNVDLRSSMKGIATA